MRNVCGKVKTNIQLCSMTANSFTSLKSFNSFLVHCWCDVRCANTMRTIINRIEFMAFHLFWKLFCKHIFQMNCVRLSFQIGIFSGGFAQLEKNTNKYIGKQPNPKPFRQAHAYGSRDTLQLLEHEKKLNINYILTPFLLFFFIDASWTEAKKEKSFNDFPRSHKLIQKII